MSERLEELQGTVADTVFRNDDNGWSVIEVRAQGDIITVVGALPALSTGETCLFGGEWAHHPQYGKQFKASSCSIQTPTTLRGIERYLGSGIIKGVGPSTARLIVEHFGQDTLQVLSEQPERLREIPGIGKKRCEQIAGSYLQQHLLRKTMVFLQTYGLSVGLSEKISKRYKDRAEEVIRGNPYQLIDDIDGIGFLTADRIALSLGFSQSGEGRLRAGLKYVLDEAAASGGHTCLPRSQLAQQAAALLRCETALIQTILSALILYKDLTCEVIEGEEVVFSPDAYVCEWAIARGLIALSAFSQQMIKAHVTGEIAKFEKEQHITFSPTQREALMKATQSGVLVITGGPGTGKTTLLNCILHILGNDEDTLLAAPTGRAAKRMSEATGREARTIHRLLEFNPEGGGFLRDRDNPLDCRCLVIDEVSMVDIYLMRSLIRAVKEGTRLILVGDKDQLPSVGPGNVLGDILASGVIPHARLTEVFRQDEHSTIVANAHRINRGEMPVLNAREGDFFFERSRSPNAAAQTIVELCAARLPKYLGGENGVKNIQVLSPTKKGECGVHRLNALLQQALNPKKDGADELVYAQTAFRAGDKVIHTKNNYMLSWRGQGGQVGQGVFNGDVGSITALDQEGRTLTVLYDDEREVDYEYAQLEELELAYCLSVHKSQGSEFDAVVMPAVGGHHLLLNRNLFYTAVTRAKKLLVLVGYEDAIEAMVNNSHSRKRYTALSLRLREAQAAAHG